jgi:hypothetical protein
MAATKVHILRNPWETSWASCGCFTANIVTHDHAEEATCLLCRQAHGLPKSVQIIEVADQVIPLIYDRDNVQVYSYSSEGWRTARFYGEWDRGRIRNVRFPMCCLPNFQGPGAIWNHNLERRPAGYHVAVFRLSTMKDWYGALRARRDVFSQMGLPGRPGSETASEAPQSARKTWLERVAEL